MRTPLLAASPDPSMVRDEGHVESQRMGPVSVGQPPNSQVFTFNGSGLAGNTSKGDYVSLNKNSRGQFVTDNIGDNMFVPSADVTTVMSPPQKVEEKKHQEERGGWHQFSSALMNLTGI